MSARDADGSRVLQLDALEALGELDCPEPRCGRDARGTGRLRHAPTATSRWYIECRCETCGSRFERWMPELDALGAALEAAGPDDHERLARAWVAGLVRARDTAR